VPIGLSALIAWRPGVRAESGPDAIPEPVSCIFRRSYPPKVHAKKEDIYSYNGCTIWHVLGILRMLEGDALIEDGSRGMQADGRV